MPIGLSAAAVCGQLIVCGFASSELPKTLKDDIAAGRRGGVILFRRNVPTLESAVELCTQIVAATAPNEPPWIGIDEEGGRVRRLPAPAIALPSMAELGARDVAVISLAASIVAAELAAIGINVNFAPVLDVHSNPANPVIGDRAFGTTSESVARCALAYLEGLQDQIVPCGKHFPGHGDTCTDSHIDLPRLPHTRGRLEALELVPFRAAINAAIPAIMSAHVIVEGVDPSMPATLSRRLCTDLLRGELGFRGVLFSDDMEMKAIAGRWTYEEAAIAAVAAGCDVLLVCRGAEAQARIHDALTREAEASPAFFARCVEAAERGLNLRRRRPPMPRGLPAVLDVIQSQEARSLVELLEHRAD